MDISIIIPVYNREKSIRRTLESLMLQSFQNFEVVIIDDGSTDNTSFIISDICCNDQRFRYYFQENKGVSNARNNGIKLSHGKYICFLDSDDFYETTFLEQMYKQIVTKNCDVCYCGYYIVKPNSKRKKTTQFTKKKVLYKYILGKVNIHTTGWLIRKEFIVKNDIEFREEISWGEDFEFFCKVLSKTEKICFVKEYLTNYTVGFNGGSSLSSFTLEKLDKDFDSISHILHYPNIKNNSKIIFVLINYRLSALLTYRLLEAFKYQADRKLILDYFNKYKKYINNFKIINGLRGLKLIVSKMILMFKLYKMRSDK
jgi:glycosyltransferase involved in cell wall biosynthesis